MREHVRMRLPTAVPVLAAALTLSACGGATHTTTSTRAAASATSTAASTAPASTAPASTTATGTIATSRTQPPPASTPTATAPAATSTSASGGVAVSRPALCRTTDLAVSFLGGAGATGHGELGFSLRNTSSHPCRTYGFPGVQFIGRGGQALPTRSTRTTQDFFGSTPLAHIVLIPGATASFRLGVTHGAASAAGCTTAAGLQVIPPDDTSALHVTIGNGGAYECQTATVSPVLPGNAAFP